MAQAEPRRSDRGGRTDTRRRPGPSVDAVPLVQPSLSDLPCVGRAPELGQLLEALRAAEGSRGSTWLVLGPSAIGKSRLLREVALLGRRQGFEVRTGFGLEGSVTPLLHFRQALRRSSSSTGARPTDSGRGWSEREGPRSIEQEILEIFAELERAGAERPQLLLLDDLETADPETLRCLRLLSRTARAQRLVVVAAARHDLTSWESTALGRSLLALRKEGLIRWIELGPLRGDARFQLVSQLLGLPVSRIRASAELGELVANSGGSPYFLIELVSAWAESDRLSREGATVPSPLLPGRTDRSSAAGVPSAMAAVIRERLRRLSPRELRLLSLAALLGPQFGADALAAATNQPVRAVAGELEPLARTGWPIAPVPHRRHVYAFEYQPVRALLRESLERAPRPAALRRLAAWWAVHRSDDPETEGRLRQAVGDVPGALACLRRSLDRLLPSGAYASIEAVLVGDGSLFSSSDRPSEALVTLALSTVARVRQRLEFYWEGRLLEGLPIDRFPEPARWTARCWLVESLAFRDADRALRLLAELERTVGEGSAAKQSEAAAMIEYLRALCHLHRADAPESAHQLLSRAASALDDGAHDFERCRILYLDGMLEASEGRLEEARRRGRELRAVLEHGREELRGMQFLSLSAESDLAYREGSVRRAVRLQRTLAREFARRGLVGLQGRTLLNLGDYEYGAREIEASREDLRFAEEIFTNLGIAGLAAASRALEGWGAVVDGSWDDAERIFRETLRLDIGTDFEGSHWASSVGLALVQAEQGRPQRALRRLPAPLRLFGAGRAGGYLAEYYCARARILELCGEVAQAKEVLLSAERQARLPLPERTELVAQLARWERLHGTAVEQRRWARRLAEMRSSLGSRSQAPWRGIGFAGRPPQTRGPAQAHGVPAPREETTATLPKRLLGVLGSGGSRVPSPGAGPSRRGLTEAEIAQRSGISRDRFSRALRRLCAEGLVERLSERPSGAARRMFVYRLSRDGAENAEKLGSGRVDASGR